MENELSRKIIGAAIEVHLALGGPGLLESIYESALCHELTLRGIQVQRQLAVPVSYNNKVIIEVKATEKNQPIYESQLLTYLRLTGLKLGLVINFGTYRVKDGISRVVNGL